MRAMQLPETENFSATFVIGIDQISSYNSSLAIMSVFLGIVTGAFAKRRFLAEILEILHFDLLPGLDLARSFSDVFCLCQLRSGRYGNA